MRFKRRLVCMLMCGCLVVASLTGTTLAANSHPSIVDTEDSRIGGSGVGYYEEVYDKVLIQSDTWLMWHPDFSKYQKVDGYFFGNTSESASVGISLGGEIINVSFSYTPVGSVSGIILEADISRYSRPAIYGDVYEEYYWSGYYNFNTKQWVTKNSNMRYKSYETDIVVEYQ